MTEVLDCTDLASRPAAIDRAVQAVGAGSVIVLPTDTLYGVGADASDPAAVAAVLAAKGRGRDMPLPVLVGSWSAAEDLVPYVGFEVKDLIDAFWPGGLTLIVEHAPTLSWDLGNTQGTVALRMPLQAVALAVLRKTGPMAVSSANRSGQPPATTVEQALAQLGDSVSVYLDDGPVAIGTASSIVDLTGQAPRLVREGAISFAELAQVAPRLQPA